VYARKFFTGARRRRSIPGRVPQEAELDADHGSVAVTPFERTPDQHLVLARSWDVD
jgi:hypothetical protein